MPRGQRLWRRVALGSSLDARGSANGPLGDFAASPHAVSRLLSRFRPEIASVIPLMHAVALSCCEDAGVHQNPHFCDLIDRRVNSRTKNMNASGARSLAETTSRRPRATTGTAGRRRSTFKSSLRPATEKSFEGSRGSPETRNALEKHSTAAHRIPQSPRRLLKAFRPAARQPNFWPDWKLAHRPAGAWPARHRV